MIRYFMILIFTSLVFASCDSKIEKEVYFSVNSQYCTDCELIVNNQNLGKLNVTDFDNIKNEKQLSNSNFLKTTLLPGSHDIIVINKKDTINHIIWTLKSDGHWKNETNGTNLTLDNFGFGATIKNIDEAIIIEMIN